MEVDPRVSSEPDMEPIQILEAALSALEEGIAVLDSESRVLFWNPAATAVSGYSGSERIARPLPDDFYVDAPADIPISALAHASPLPGAAAWPRQTRPIPVHLKHQSGHVLPAMLRLTPLRDPIGRRFGTLLRFHPAEEIDRLSRSEADSEEASAASLDPGLDQRIEQSRTGMEERLDEAWHEWTTEAIPFGLLWVRVDQAAMLRRTHGHDACEAMMAILERTLMHGLRPAEAICRWSTHEFLILCHERSPEMLFNHARHLEALAPSADFRWWGDRVPLTVTIGAAQAGPAKTEPGPDHTLASLLEQAKTATQASMQAAD